MDGYPCPNPRCPHVFSADEIHGVTTLVCPKCESRFPLQPGVDEPPATEEDAAALVEWRGRQAPPSNIGKLYTVLLVASGAVTMSLLGLWWYNLLPGMASGRAQTYHGKKYNFNLVVPQGPWKEDDSVRKSLDARVALVRTDPLVWLAVLVKDYRTSKPRDAELNQEAIKRLRQHFKDSVELGEDTQEVEVAGKPALRREFQGTRDSVVLRGDCYMLTYRGFAYWVLIWAPDAADARAAWGELTEAGRGLVLLDERQGWTEQPPKLKSYPVLSKGTGFTVQAPSGIWEEMRPNDEKQLLYLVGRDPAARRGDNAKNAYVIAYRMPKQPDLPAAARAAREALAARVKKQSDDFTVAPVSAADKEGIGSGLSLGDRAARTLELARSDAGEQKDYYLLLVTNEAESVMVLECRCAWDQRQAWRLLFLDLAGTLSRSD
jgi:hypothetical protein